MKLAFGCDACASALKAELIAYATELGHECFDCGVHEGDWNQYPIFSARVAKRVLSGEAERGIVICGTGVGVSLVANKFKGIRCALCGDCYTAKYTRLHNDANVLCLGGRVVGPGLALELVDIFLSTEFEGGRHIARLDMIKDIEKSQK